MRESRGERNELGSDFCGRQNWRDDNQNGSKPMHGWIGGACECYCRGTEPTSITMRWQHVDCFSILDVSDMIYNDDFIDAWDNVAWEKTKRRGEMT